MIIEFQNCDLEISYIGTPTEIQMAKFNEAVQMLIETVCDMGERALDAIQDWADSMKPRIDKMMIDIGKTAPTENDIANALVKICAMEAKR